MTYIPIAVKSLNTVPLPDCLTKDEEDTNIRYPMSATMVLGVAKPAILYAPSIITSAHCVIEIQHYNLPLAKALVATRKACAKHIGLTTLQVDIGLVLIRESKAPFSNWSANLSVWDGHSQHLFEALCKTNTPFNALKGLIQETKRKYQILPDTERTRIVRDAAKPLNPIKKGTLA